MDITCFHKLTYSDVILEKIMYEGEVFDEGPFLEKIILCFNEKRFISLQNEIEYDDIILGFDEPSAFANDLKDVKPSVEQLIGSHPSWMWEMKNQHGFVDGFSIQLINSKNPYESWIVVFQSIASQIFVSMTSKV